ncbi:MAG: RNA polymerase sigma factor [Saprospiraceae bacterium]
MQHPHTDEYILTLIAAPEQREAGFRLLLQQYGDRLYHHIRRMVVQDDDTKDVLQNTLLRISQHIGNFEARSQLYTWLYRVATNEALTFLEQRRRKQSRTAFLSDNNDEWLHQQKAEPQLEGAYIRQRLEMAMEQLPPKQKAVFSLRYFEEKSYQEMAAIFSTSEGALKASYHHAVKKLNPS